ncbi:hypothetical protein VMCG_01375 [Cytospora schulzeri]|uniref:C3H1-type domain-containing protein n=1 Tax=Cytospora schulzeri TaxID=448051 RepID=A0A423X4T4_9PEZI|nr:hypothetical protein VMCG_01375 [Valsa malicola]
MEQVDSPSNEELEAEAVRRFEEYQAIKTKHQRRKNDLEQTLEREKRRIDGEVQSMRDQLEEELQGHIKDHAAAVDDERRRYHAELKEARRQSGPGRQPDHTPSTEEMEAEEMRLFEAFQRMRTAHEKQVNSLQQILGIKRVSIQERMGELRKRTTPSLAGHTARMEMENLRYMAELREFRRQRSQGCPAESNLQYSNPNGQPLARGSPAAENTTHDLPAEGSVTARSFPSQEQSPGQPQHGAESRHSLGGTKALGSPLRGLTPQQQEEVHLPSSSSSVIQQPNTAQTPPANPSHIQSDRRGRWHTFGPELGPASGVTGADPATPPPPSSVPGGGLDTAQCPQHRSGEPRSIEKAPTGDLHVKTPESRPNLLLDRDAQAEPGTSKRAYGNRSEGLSPEPGRPATKKHKTTKTILFNEVNAEMKDWRVEEIYIIIEYPVKSNKWYILRCQKCGLICFTAQGAAKHLSGKTHGAERRWDLAVEELGVQVVDCGEEKARRNNAAFEEACKQGHQPKSRLDRRTWASNGSRHHGSIASCGRDRGVGWPKGWLDDSDSDYVPSDGEVHEPIPKGEQESEPFLGVAEPVAGELYQVYWEEDETWYPVTVLPLGSLREIGIAGNLRDLGLILTIPSCYEVGGDGFDIVGWKPHVQASGPPASERQFPCLFFDEDFEVPLTGRFAPPDGPHYAWLSAKDLRYIDYRQPGGHIINTAGRTAAKNFRKRLMMMRDPRPAAQPEADMVGQGSISMPRDQDRGHAVSSEDARADKTSVVHQRLQGGSTSPVLLELDRPTDQDQRQAPIQSRQGPTALKATPSGPREKEKVYCRSWIRRGCCDHSRRSNGCKFKHEMPDSQTRRSLGLGEDLPRWWRKEQKRKRHRRSPSRDVFPALRPGSQRWTPGN